MKRVAFLVSNPCTSDGRVIKMVQAAVCQGHEVHVFGTLGSGAPAYEVKDTVTYHRLEWKPVDLEMRRWLWRIIAQFVPRKVIVGFLRRYVQYRKYQLFADIFGPLVSSVGPEIIHAHDLICLPAASKAALTCGAKVIYDAHELEAHRNPPLSFFKKQWVKYVERRYAKRADALITVGAKIRDVLAGQIGRDDIHVIYNSPICRDSVSSLRDDLQIGQQVPMIVYVGKVTQGRGVGDILALLPKIPGVFFAAVGPADKAVLEILQAQAKRLNVAERFRVLPPVPFDQVVSYIKGATLGVISVEPVTLSYKYCMPNKLFELAFADIPIISNDLDEIREFLNELRLGIVADFRDTYQLPNQIQKLIARAELYKLSPSSRCRLDGVYSWSAQERKLKAIYESLG